ncbi:MAG: hypothetical protein ACOCU4_10790, partial [Alkalispirochaeta sp.]
MKTVRWIGVYLAVACVLLTLGILTACDIADLLAEEDEEEANQPPYESLPTLQAIVYAPRLISSSDVCLSGSISVSETISGSTATIAFSGNVSLHNSPFGSAEIDAAVTFPVSTDGHANTDAESLEVSGSVSLDGESWHFADVIDAVEGYEEDLQQEELLPPCRSRFFAAGYSTIGHSPDGRRWDALEIAPDHMLTAIAADDAGNLVAVGAGSFDYQPQGSGLIYHGSNGDSWSL